MADVRSVAVLKIKPNICPKCNGTGLIPVRCVSANRTHTWIVNATCPCQPKEPSPWRGYS